MTTTTATKHECPLCRAHSIDDRSIPESIIESGQVIYVSGIQYAAFEAMTRSVFSQMPSAFETHFGASFLKYKPNASQPLAFTLVVTGDGNKQAPSVLRELLSRVDNIFAFGPMTREETEMLTGGSVPLPSSVGRVSAVGVEDWAEHLADGMKTSLVAMSPGSAL